MFHFFLMWKVDFCSCLWHHVDVVVGVYGFRWGSLCLRCFSTGLSFSLLMGFKACLQRRAPALLKNTSCRVDTKQGTAKVIRYATGKTFWTHTCSTVPRNHKRTHNVNTHTRLSFHLNHLRVYRPRCILLPFIYFPFFLCIDSYIGVFGKLRHILLDYHVLGLTICVLLHPSTALLGFSSLKV